MSTSELINAVSGMTAQLAQMQQENARRDEAINQMMEVAQRMHRNRPSILASPRVKFEEPASARRNGRQEEDEEVEAIGEIEVVDGLYIPATRTNKWSNVSADEIDAEFNERLLKATNLKAVEAITSIMKRAHLYGLPWYRLNAQLILEGATMRTAEREDLENRIKKYQSATYNRGPTKQRPGNAQRRTPSRKPGGYGKPKQGFRQ